MKYSNIAASDLLSPFSN